MNTLPASQWKPAYKSFTEEELLAIEKNFLELAKDGHSILPTAQSVVKTAELLDCDVTLADRYCRGILWEALGEWRWACIFSPGDSLTAAEHRTQWLELRDDFLGRFNVVDVSETLRECGSVEQFRRTQ